MTPDEAYEAYEEIVVKLKVARETHDALYKEATEAYRRWISLGGEHKDEEGYGHR